MKKLFLLAVLFLFSFSNLSADTTYFVDFKKVLNNSKAGASAQENLKKKYTNESNKFIQEEKNIRKEEAEIISNAGYPSAVTIATNMAGRGTDIQLGGNLEFALNQKNKKIDKDRLTSEIKKINK